MREPVQAARGVGWGGVAERKRGGWGVGAQNPKQAPRPVCRTQWCSIS